MAVRYDIIFLDIFMPLLNGMEAAKELRGRDKTVKIVFLTSTPEFALESYSVKATDYCIKPITYLKIKEIMDELSAQTRQEPESLTLKTVGGYQKIYLHDIEYIDLLYSGSEVVFEFLPFVLCVAYLIFSVVYFREYEANREAEQHNRLIELKRAQSEKEIEAIKRSEYAISLLRHDMRHFMNNIISYIEQGETEKAKSYIREFIAAADKTAMKRYCENEIVNMIISSYENQINENGINFHHSIQIPAKLSVSDVDLTSILSNGLENAINAVLDLDLDKRTIILDLRMNDDKLLLSIKNPYAHTVEMVDGMPMAKRNGHGLGTNSIKYIAEKLNGNCQFVAQNGQFTLRVVL